MEEGLGRRIRRALRGAFAPAPHRPARLLALALLVVMFGPAPGPIQPRTSRPSSLTPARLVLSRMSGRAEREYGIASDAAPVPRSNVWPTLPVEQAAVNIPIPVRIPPGARVPSTAAGHSDGFTLSFDDCGDPAAMGAVVDRLVSAHRQALFFVTGQCRDRYPWLLGELSRAGQLACNHTYSHPDLSRLSDAQIRAEIAAGVRTGCPYFRPPFGSWDGPRGRVARIAREFGLSILMWDVDTRDWAGAEAAPMVEAVRRRGGVVLFHLHGSHTLEALDQLLA